MSIEWLEELEKRLGEIHDDICVNDWCEELNAALDYINCARTEITTARLNLANDERTTAVNDQKEKTVPEECAMCANRGKCAKSPKATRNGVCRDYEPEWV